MYFHYYKKLVATAEVSMSGALAEARHVPFWRSLNIRLLSWCGGALQRVVLMDFMLSRAWWVLLNPVMCWRKWGFHQHEISFMDHGCTNRITHLAMRPRRSRSGGKPVTWDLSAGLLNHQISIQLKIYGAR